MSDYTPTTKEVRANYLPPRTEIVDADNQFDRWLAEVKAQAWEDGFSAALFSEQSRNPYRQVDRVCGACSDDPNEAENACWGCAKAYRQGEN